MELLLCSSNQSLVCHSMLAIRSRSVFPIVSTELSLIRIIQELRVQDYAQGRKTASAASGAFGQTAFGAAQPAPTTNLFGQPAQQPTTSIFGGGTNTAAPSAFGAFGAQNTTQPAAPATNSLFGGTGAFGQTQPQQPNAFGGGTGAFGQTQQQQPQQQTSIFGGGGGAFGSTANKPSPFGASKPLFFFFVGIFFDYDFSSRNKRVRRTRCNHISLRCTNSATCSGNGFIWHCPAC